jgi:hypothetical protein
MSYTLYCEGVLANNYAQIGVRPKFATTNVDERRFCLEFKTFSHPRFIQASNEFPGCGGTIISFADEQKSAL